MITGRQRDRVIGLISKIGIEEAIKRLEGVQVSDHRLVGEHAERAENQTPTNLADTSRVGQTEGRVPLDELEDHLRSEAAMMERVRRLFHGDDYPEDSPHVRSAAVSKRWLAILVEARRGTPTESDSEEVEERWRWVSIERPWTPYDESLPPSGYWQELPSRGKRTSGACLPNAQGMARRPNNGRSSDTSTKERQWTPTGKTTSKNS